jgi:hypothetical protein
MLCSVMNLDLVFRNMSCMVKLSAHIQCNCARTSMAYVGNFIRLREKFVGTVIFLMYEGLSVFWHFHCE